MNGREPDTPGSTCLQGCRNEPSSEPKGENRCRILKAQGADAPGGAHDYVVRGKMIGALALVAYPANWGNSGVMTFIANHNGVAYQKDFGPDTTAAARTITRFDPHSTWTRL
jgi:DUF2950 family protein